MCIQNAPRMKTLSTKYKLCESAMRLSLNGAVNTHHPPGKEGGKHVKYAKWPQLAISCGLHEHRTRWGQAVMCYFLRLNWGLLQMWMCLAHCLNELCVRMCVCVLETKMDISPSWALGGVQFPPPSSSGSRQNLHWAACHTILIPQLVISRSTIVHRTPARSGPDQTRSQ